MNIKVLIAAVLAALLPAMVTADTSFQDVRDAIIHVLEEKPLPDDCDADAAAWFMLEVAYVESGIVRNGEIVFVDGTNGYDYGAFQTNLAAARDILSRCDPAEVERITGYTNGDLKRELCENPKLGAYIFRQKFGHQSFRDSNGERSNVWKGVASLNQRAVFWKREYNTHLGAGTVSHYMERVPTLYAWLEMETRS